MSTVLAYFFGAIIIASVGYSLFRYEIGRSLIVIFWLLVASMLFLLAKGLFNF